MARFGAPFFYVYAEGVALNSSRQLKNFRERRVLRDASRREAPQEEGFQQVSSPCRRRAEAALWRAAKSPQDEGLMVKLNTTRAQAS